MENLDTEERNKICPLNQICMRFSNILNEKKMYELITTLTKETYSYNAGNRWKNNSLIYRVLQKVRRSVIFISKTVYQHEKVREAFFKTN